MYMVQNLMERLRPLVGLKGWDFCLLWKLSDDQRFLEWMDCCCGGTDQSNGGEEEHVHQFSGASSAIFPCRDGIFQHPTTKSCELLSHLPTTLSLDESGNIHAEALISNFPRWLNFSSSSSGSTLLEETVGTRVLIPVPAGLIELFVAKQVPEDQQVIEIVKSEFSSVMMMNHQEAVESADFSVSIMSTEEIFHPQSYDFSVDRLHGMCSSPMNLLQQFSYSNEENNLTTKSNNNNNSSLFFEGGEEQNGGNNNNEMHQHHHHEEVEFGESTVGKEQRQGNDHDKEGIKQEMNGRSDSISDCSDQNADDDQQQYSNKYRRKNGKPEAKNLQAERRRRKRLNGRLYDLRALVPIISDLKKASIIGDAIEFVKELKRQAKELEEELEANSDDEEISRNSIFNNNNNNSMATTHVVLGQNVGMNEPDSVSGLAKVLNQESEINHEKGQQMEVQVEVAQIDGNGFFVKVFCEHRAGGFVRLLEALDSLGLEVTNANVTSCKSLVSNVFRVQKKDSEMVQAEYVRDSLLELTREPLPRTWTEIQVKASENRNGMMDHHHHQHHLHPSNYNHHQVMQQNGHLMNSDQLYPATAPQLNMSFSNLI